VKTYNYRKNAVAAARKELDDTGARADVHFTITETDGKFGYSLIDARSCVVKGVAAVEVTVQPGDPLEIPAVLKRPMPIGAELEQMESRLAYVAKTSGPNREIVSRKSASTKVDGAPRETKIGAVLEKAKTAGGITVGEIHKMTGWSKIGGFFGAARRAGLTLTRTREDKVTTYRASVA
jgi:hypothetical protein